jgi:hypothetical protein
MRKLAAGLLLSMTLALVAAPTALAVKPKLPSTWSGGNGKGLPMGFTLSKSGKVTAAYTGYTCKGKSGIGNASSKAPKGVVSSKGKLTITYLHKGIRVKFAVTFTSKTRAKGTITFTSSTCTVPKITFTAQEGVEG